MHYHVEWSSTGFSSERFESYPEAFDAAQQAAQRAQPKIANDQPPAVRPDETFKIEPFDEVCPVCLRAERGQRA